MDVSFTNVLEGARQYFQGLPVPSGATTSSTASTPLSPPTTTTGASPPTNDTRNDTRHDLRCEAPPNPANVGNSEEQPSTTTNNQNSSSDHPAQPHPDIQNPYSAHNPGSYHQPSRQAPNESIAQAGYSQAQPGIEASSQRVRTGYANQSDGGGEVSRSYGDGVNRSCMLSNEARDRANFNDQSNASGSLEAIARSGYSSASNSSGGNEDVSRGVYNQPTASGNSETLSRTSYEGVSRSNYCGQTTHQGNSEGLHRHGYSNQSRHAGATEAVGRSSFGHGDGLNGGGNAGSYNVQSTASSVCPANLGVSRGNLESVQISGHSSSQPNLQNSYQGSAEACRRNSVQDSYKLCQQDGYKSSTVNSSSSQSVQNNPNVQTNQEGYKAGSASVSQEGRENTNFWSQIEVPDTRPEEDLDVKVDGINNSANNNSADSDNSGNSAGVAEHSRQSPSFGQSDGIGGTQVYQQLSGNKGFGTEVLSPHQIYQENRQPPSQQPITQRAQYYPRYHHPDITKSAPAPFSQSSVYQSSNVSVSSSNSSQTNTRPTPIEQNGPSEQQRVATSYGQTPTGYGAQYHQQGRMADGGVQSPETRVHIPQPPTRVTSTNPYTSRGILHTSPSTPNLGQSQMPPPSGYLPIASPHESSGTGSHGSHSHAQSPQRQSPHINQLAGVHININHGAAAANSHGSHGTSINPHGSVTPHTSVHGSVHGTHEGAGLNAHSVHPGMHMGSHSTGHGSSHVGQNVHGTGHGGQNVHGVGQNIHGTGHSGQNVHGTGHGNQNVHAIGPGSQNIHGTGQNTHGTVQNIHGTGQNVHAGVHSGHIQHTNNGSNPHTSPHHTPSPHSNFQPHSPTYPPPPPRSTAQNYGGGGSGHYQGAQGYASGQYGGQASYHSFQKSPQPQGYYAQQPRPPSYPLQQPLQCSSDYQKPVTYNGDSKPLYTTYHRPTPPQRSNAHNLPPIASLSSYHSTKRESQNSAQALPRQRISHPSPSSQLNSSHAQPTNPIASNKVSIVSSPMMTQRDYQLSQANQANQVSAMSQLTQMNQTQMNQTSQMSQLNQMTQSNHALNGRTASRYVNNYPYATTIAPSHHNNNPNTVVTSVGTSSRSSAPYQSSDASRLYHQSHQSQGHTTLQGQSVQLPVQGHQNVQGQVQHSVPGVQGQGQGQCQGQREGFGYKEYGYGSNTNSSGVGVSSSQGQAQNGVVRKRESPLDLSVKTVKTPADSTAQDDVESSSTDKQHISSSQPSRNNGRLIPPILQSTPPPPSSFSFDRPSPRPQQPPSSTLRAPTPTVCAPKVDFLPDFNSTPLRQPQVPAENLRRGLGVNPNPNNTHLPTSNLTSQPAYTSQQHGQISYKKSPLPTSLYDVPATSSSNYMNDSNRSQRYAINHEPRLNPANQPVTQEYLEAKAKLEFKSMQRERSLKRTNPAEVYAGPNKQPRLDTWRLAIDKQIQQRLTTARAIYEQQKRQEMNLPVPLPNGTLVNPGNYEQRSDSGYSSSESTRYQNYAEKRNYGEVQKMGMSYNNVNSVGVNVKSPIERIERIERIVNPVGPVQGHQSHQGHQTVQGPQGHVQGHQGHYTAFRQRIPSSGNIAQEQTVNTGADKRVLSLLRNSLESKQQREEQMHSQQPILVNSQQSFQNKVVAPVEPKTNIGRHNLSPFTAASLLERNSNTPPHYKFHVPRAVDSITQQSMYASRVNSSATLPKEALLGPRTGTESQICRDKDDGLAAILAAKIRTKAELKQVGTGQFISKPSSVPSQDASSTPKEFDSAASTSTPQSGSSAGSPPKLTREKAACLPPRRRLFSRTEEENMPIAGTVPTPGAASAVPARASGFRSSSETSVFDFRESDSEGEMPVLERQTLEEMRRDRKQLSKVQPPVPLNDAMCMEMASSMDLVKIELKENDKITEADPFWTATCDKFMEQLRTGDGAKKRGRKKKSESNTPTKPEDPGNESDKGCDSNPQPQIKPEDIKKEINPDDDETFSPPENPKLSKNTRPLALEDTEMLVQDVKVESKDGNSITETTKEVKEFKDFDELTDSKESQEFKDLKEPKEHKEVKELKDFKETKDNEDVKEFKELQGNKEARECKEYKESKGHKEAKEYKEFKESKGTKGSKDIKVKKEGYKSDDSDETPLIKRTRKRSTMSGKKSESDCEDDITCRKRRIRRGSRIKLESSSGSDSSSEESDVSSEFGQGSSVAERLRARKRVNNPSESEGMKLRSRDTTPHKSKSSEHNTRSSTSKVGPKPKPKPLFGDGSDFRPGWEDEVYVYKKSLRMPTRLINVSKPSRFHRLSTSLPDLDPGSPSLSVSMDSSDVCLSRKKVLDSDVESNYSYCPGIGGGFKVDDEEATSSTTVSCPPKTSKSYPKLDNSIVDVLAQKVGSSKKEQKEQRRRKEKEKPHKLLRKSSNELELLPTPSLTPLISDTKSTGNGNKGKSPVKTKTPKPIKVTDSFLLGYFRKETVNNFRDTFKNHALPNEFSTFVLKSRTRTETRVLKKQATIREVFGEDRPASAPPMQNHGESSQDDDSQNEQNDEPTDQNASALRNRTLKQKVVSRLRNAGILRSHKAIINSKKHLLIAKRRKDLLKSLAEKKLQRIKSEAKTEKNESNDANEDENNEANEEDENNEEAPSKKKLKFRSGRRKFRSGFDYIRKKKKPLKKDESLPKERKRQVLARPSPECVADIQSEIRTWVIKKGVGETILHRAARLGYTDVTAYCLEKLNSAPSPKDNAGYTPLHEACSKGHLEIAKLLLAYGANASESANGGIRPLHEAAENGATELVRLLLSYGADPLLATYSGQTPLMLAVDTDAYSILEQHLDDIQGRNGKPWSFAGPSTVFDSEETGYNPLDDPPLDSPESDLEEVEMEVSDINLPVLFSLSNDPDKWVLLQDLMSALRVKSRDALLRQVNPKAHSGPPAVAHREVMKELKLPDFLEQSRCCHLLSGGERINVRGSKVTLIKYNDKVKSLLNVERVVISLR